ncbi:MAG: hypothetical protein KBA06_03455 [Saprospiraceae bacterium]|nr:hypothetical protein [Saprospiraceae bacterium]
MYRSWWQLHRVEADDKFMYITNYFKTIRYQANDIEKIILKKGFFSSKAYVVLKSKGVFGQMIRFRPNQPHLFELMTKSENWAGVVRVLK